MRRLASLAPFVLVEVTLVAIFQAAPLYRQAAVFAASIAAVTFGLYNFLSSQTERRVGAALDLMHRWNSADFWPTRSIARRILRKDVPIELIMMKRIDGGPEPLRDEPASLRDAVILQCGLLETVALSIRHGMADETALYHYFKKPVLTSYPTLEPWILHERLLWQNESFFEHYEALYRRWDAINASQRLL